MKSALPVIILGLAFVIGMGIAKFFIGDLMKKEAQCTTHCWDKQWPHATYSRKRKSCYCYNDLKREKAYTLGEDE